MTLRRFSHSLIDCYLDCPKKAEYRYVKNVPSPRTTALVKGSAMDEAANADLEHYMATGKHLSLEEMTDKASDAFYAMVGREEIDWQGSDEDTAFESTLRLTRTWRQQLAPDIVPTAIQVEYHRTLPSGRDFIGFVDWEGEIDGVPVIGDNKTAQRRFSAGDADKSLQPYAYAWLKGEPINFVFARSIDTGKSQSAEFAWTQRSLEDNAWYEDIVLNVERAFDEGIFPANPRSNLCSPKHCPYYAQCQPHRIHGEDKE